MVGVVVSGGLAVPIFNCPWKIRMLVITSLSTGLNKMVGVVVSGGLLIIKERVSLLPYTASNMSL